MDNKLPLFLIALLLLPSAYALSNNPNEWGSLIAPAWDYISGYWGETSSDKISGMFGYTLEPWELEICSTHTTNDMNYKQPPGFTGASTDLTNIYAPITATMMAQKHSYDDNLTLTEVSWYIQPKDAPIKYSVYYKKGATKYYLPKFKNIEVDHVQGMVGYYVEYLQTNFTEAVLEYESGEVILSVPITEKGG